jgi:hypothetical protein
VTGDYTIKMSTFNIEKNIFVQTVLERYSFTANANFPNPHCSKFLCLVSVNLNARNHPPCRVFLFGEGRAYIPSKCRVFLLVDREEMAIHRNEDRILTP